MNSLQGQRSKFSPQALDILKSVGLVLLLSLFALSPANGAEWTGGIEGGTVIRDGDSATRLRFAASLSERPLSHYVYAEWLRSAANQYEIGYQPRYWLNEKLYSFGEGRLRLEDSASIDRTTSVLVGLGIQLIETKASRVTLEGGVGYQMVNYNESTGLEDLGSGVGLIRGSGQHTLSNLFKFELSANVFTSDSYLESNLEAGLSMRMAQGAVKISRRIRRIDNDGLAEIDDADTTVAFTVGF